MLWRLVRLIVKEFFVVLRDPKSRVFLVVPPLLQLFVFSFAATHDVRNVHLGVYDRDRGKPARELVARFHAAPGTFSRVTSFDRLDDARKALDEQDVLAVLRIGPDFSRRVEAGQPAMVQVLLDGRQANAALVVQGYANRIVQDYLAERQALSGGGEPEAIAVRMWFNPNLSPIWSAASALLAILLNLVALMITALSVARERELGTFEQLLVSPLRPMEILLGKAVPAILLAFVEGMFMVAILRFVFRLPFTGSLPALFLAVLLFLVATVGVGLFISSLTSTQQQGFLGAFVYMVPSVLLSGFATPVANIPDWLRWLAYVNPLQYMVTISRAMFLEGPDASTVIGMIWPLIPIGLATLTAATWLFRRKME